MKQLTAWGVKCFSVQLFFLLVVLNFGVQAVLVQPDFLPKPGEMVLNSEKDIPRHVWVAEQYLKVGEYGNVVMICDRIVRMEPNHIDARSHLAAAYKGLGETKQFELHWNSVRKQSPTSPAPFLSLSLMYQSRKESHQAEAILKDGLAKGASSTEIRMSLGALYSAAGKLKMAADQYEAVLEKKKLDAKYHLNANFAMCRIDLQRKAYNDVIKRAKNLTEMYPPIPISYQFLANANLRKGDVQAAIGAYDKLINANNNTPLPYHELALIYSDIVHDSKMAVTMAETAIKRFPKDSKSHDVLGWVNYQAGSYRLAVDSFQKTVELSPNNAQFYYHLGLAYQKLNEKKSARKAYEKAITLLGDQATEDFSRELKNRLAQCS